MTAGILHNMRFRWGLLASALTCTVLLTAYENATSSARAVPSQLPAAESSNATARANELPPGDFRFTTGLAKVPQHIEGPVTCDTRDDTYRIAIGDQEAGGVEIGLQEESSLKYVDLGNRSGVNLALINNGNTGDDPSGTPPSVHKTGDTYFVSGYATGLTASQQDTSLYFEISVACP